MKIIITAYSNSNGRDVTVADLPPAVSADAEAGRIGQRVINGTEYTLTPECWSDNPEQGIAVDVAPTVSGRKL